jgi:hypothetical protein
VTQEVVERPRVEASLADFWPLSLDIGRDGRCRNVEPGHRRSMGRTGYRFQDDVVHFAHDRVGALEGNPAAGKR